MFRVRELSNCGFRISRVDALEPWRWAKGGRVINFVGENRVSSSIIASFNASSVESWSSMPDTSGVEGAPRTLVTGISCGGFKFEAEGKGGFNLITLGNDIRFDVAFMSTPNSSFGSSDVALFGRESSSDVLGDDSSSESNLADRGVLGLSL